MPVAARATWTGQLRLSLVSIPIRLYNAVRTTTKTPLNQLHKDCHHRVRQQLTCPEHGKLEREQIVKGYEFEKDKYVVVSDEDLAKIKLETTHTIELVQFIDESELDPIYLDGTYYVTPDGPLAEEAFRVVREAMRMAKKVAIGRVVMAGREYTTALRPYDKGFRLSTLHYADDIRTAEPYFEEIKNGDVDKNQLNMAKQLIENYTAPFQPNQFSDRYQDALLAIIKSKIEGTEPVLAQQSETTKVISLMDALQQSIAQAKPQKGARKPPAASKDTPKAQPKKKAKSA
jgi:DNA end-binding protein Ku